MSNTPETEPQAKSRGFTLYIFIWMLLGGIAAGYLVALAVKPDLVAEYMPAFRSDDPEKSIVGEVRSLRESVSQVQLDVARLTVEVSEQGEHAKEVTERVTALESRPPMAAVAVDSATMAAARDPAEGGPTAADAISAAMQSGEPPAKPAETQPAPQPAEPVKGLETGSVAKDAPASFGQAVVKPAAKPAGVQIGSAPSVDALRLNWLALSDRHGEALKNLQARYVAGRDENGEVYKLIAGPVKSTAEAKRICTVLEGDGVACSVGSYGGNAL